MNVRQENVGVARRVGAGVGVGLRQLFVRGPDAELPLYRRR